MKMRISSSSISVCIPALIISLFAAFFMVAPSKTDVRSNHTTVPGRAAGETSAAPKQARILDEYKNLSLAFERNMGQSDSRVRYLAHGAGYELFLTPQEAVFTLLQPQPIDGSKPRFFRSADLSRKASVLRLELAGANPSAEIQGSGQLQRKANYFTGNDHTKWVTDVPSYERVEYRGVYPGIDLSFYGNQRRLEYDYVVSPGANPQAIAFQLKGAKKLRVDGQGNLVVGTASGAVTFRKPLMYQMDNGRTQPINGKYLVAKNNEIRFAVPEYDRSRALVIDPVVDYSSYLGGSSVGDTATGVAVDTVGNAFVTGTTYNASFPLSTSPATNTAEDPGDANLNTQGAAFVSEIDPTGANELFFTYISGDGGEIAYAVAVDPAPNTNCMNGTTPESCVYVVGQTFSDNFPESLGLAPYDSTTPLGGAPTTGNAFVTKLDPYATTTTHLLYSTYIASSNGGDLAHGVAVDSAQNAYVTGQTFEAPGAPPAFPNVHPAQSAAPSASGSAFLTVFNTTTTGSVLYSTYLEGNDANAGTNPLGIGEAGTAVVVDSNDVAYIVGITSSTNFPNFGSTGTFANIKGWLGYNGSNTQGEAFVAAINTLDTGGTTSLVYSTYLGGSTAELGYGITLGGSGVVFVTGQTKSADFPVTQTGTTNGQFPSPIAATGVVFVTRLNTATGGASNYSVALGGVTGDVGNSIQVDSLGNVIVAGTTSSADFPLTPGAIKPALTGSLSGDAFVAKLNPNATGAAGLLYSSYFGGGGQTGEPDAANGVALDSAGNAYLAGTTFSSDFPVSTGAFETSPLSGAASAGFISKLTLIPALAFGSPCAFDYTVTPISSCTLTFGNQLFHTASTPMTFTLTNNTSANITLTIPPTTSGTNASDFVAAATAVGANPACSTTLAAGAACGIGVTFTPSTSGTAEAAILSVAYTFSNGSPGAGGTFSPTQTVELTGTGIAPVVSLNPPTTLTFTTPLPVGSTSTPGTETVTNTGTGALDFTAAPTITGTNASDFAIAGGTTCTNGSSVPTNSSCVINVTFTPTGVGTRTATLTITDNATGSPQTITLTGTGVATAPVVSVTPATLTFTGQLVTTTSASQAVTVKNTGTAVLNITAAPSIGGTNATDFAIATGSTCTSGATVAANGGTCVINITFTPPTGASGARSAILSIADNATGSPQTVTLSGTAWDFSLSAQPITVTRGTPGTIAVTVTGLGGFTGAVTLSCAATIPQGSCTPPTAAVTATGTGNMTITTKAGVPVPMSKRTPPFSTHQVTLVLLAMMLLLSLPVARRFRTRLSLAGAAALLVVIAGCSSPLPTTLGTYTVTITGTSGGVSHSTTVNLTVN
jgi:beta-propeller repeat-containing protein